MLSSLCAAGAFALGLLSKESAVMCLPLAVLWDLGRGGPALLRKTWKAHALYGGVLLAFAAVRFGLMRGPMEAGMCSFFFPWVHRVYFAAKGAATALRLFFFPAFLSIEYFTVFANSWREIALWLSAVSPSS